MGRFGAGTTKLFLLGAMVFLAAGTASAETFGSASIATLRNCAVANACVFNGPALAVQEKGGLRQNVSDYRDFGGGSVSAGYVNFD